MNQSISVIGWTSAYLSAHPTVSFTSDRRKALVERIRKRKYNFTYQSHQPLPYAAPFFSDNTLCVLTKEQWDDVIAEAYGEMKLGARLTPMDIIDDEPFDDVLFEKPKFKEQFKAGDLGIYFEIDSKVKALTSFKNKVEVIINISVLL